MKGYSFALSMLLIPGSVVMADATLSPGQKSSQQEFSHFRQIFDPNSLKNDKGLWVDVEALFWQSNVGGMDYALKSSSTSSIQHGQAKSPHFKWDLGARVGLGYKLPYDHWDLFINYTYVHANAEGKTHTTNGAVYPQWAAIDTDTYVTQAKANWHANVNMADLELGRNCFAGKWLTIRPFFGIRGLVLDQQYKVSYKGGTAFPADQAKLHLNTDFWGLGLRFGLDSLWGLCKGLGLYGNGSVSLLSGHFDVHEKEHLKQAHTQLMKVSRDVDNLVVTADLALGLKWDYMFSKDRYHLGVKLGWEFNVFFDQNQLFNFMSSTNPGSINFHNDDLSFQGITLGLRFDF